MTKACAKCKQELPLSDFYVYKPSKSRPSGGPHSYCKGCDKKATMASQAKRPPEALRESTRVRVKRAIDNRADWYVNYLARQKVKGASRRAEVLAAYGGACACCGETIPEFLAVDHIHEDGSEHRKAIGGTGRLYEWLKKNNFPKDRFQLLCWNCNRGKSICGQCPHVAMRKRR
jgi:hypothetical protein